ncbi:MAG: DUF86 domain-containing protein [Candidatus Hodarchaeaceae archaeon]|nr:DUF86 domain-containing protein [Candidatus Hodarchaeaceae archaeon]
MMMKRCTDFLRANQHVSSEELEKNYALRSAIERNFQVAIEAALDTAEVIISEEGFEKPEDYRGAILELGRGGILPPEFAERFAPAAGFRNILVHGYAEVDIKKLHELLLEGPKDFDEFARHVAKHLEKG